MPRHRLTVESLNLDETFLTEPEVALLTGRKKRSAQVRALENKAIPYILNCDGFPLILRENVFRSRGVPTQVSPNFDAAFGK